MGKDTEGLEKIQEEFETENERIVMLTQVMGQVNSSTIRERRQNGEIAASSGVLVAMGSTAASSLAKKDIKVAGVWSRVEVYPNKEPDSRCELSCWWGHIENKCGSMPKCGYYSGLHRTSDHAYNVVGCCNGMVVHGMSSAGYHPFYIVGSPQVLDQHRESYNLILHILPLRSTCGTVILQLLSRPSLSRMPAYTSLHYSRSSVTE